MKLLSALLPARLDIALEPWETYDEVTRVVQELDSFGNTTMIIVAAGVLLLALAAAAGIIFSVKKRKNKNVSKA